MAYKYCKNCDGERAIPPTTAQVLNEREFSCYQCGETREFFDEEKSEALIDLLDRIERIESLLNLG